MLNLAAENFERKDSNQQMASQKKQGRSLSSAQAKRFPTLFHQNRFFCSQDLCTCAWWVKTTSGGVLGWPLDGWWNDENCKFWVVPTHVFVILFVCFFFVVQPCLGMSICFTCSAILDWRRVSIVPGVRVRPNTNHWVSYHQFFMWNMLVSTIGFKKNIVALPSSLNDIGTLDMNKW